MSRRQLRELVQSLGQDPKAKRLKELQAIVKKHLGGNNHAGDN